MQISTERLRRALLDYYGLALEQGFVEAQIDLDRIQNADQDELIEAAIEEDFDLEHFKI